MTKLPTLQFFSNYRFENDFYMLKYTHTNKLYNTQLKFKNEKNEKKLKNHTYCVCVCVCVCVRARARVCVCVCVNPALCSDRATKYVDSRIGQFNFSPLTSLLFVLAAAAPLSRSLLSKAS